MFTIFLYEVQRMANLTNVHEAMQNAQMKEKKKADPTSVCAVRVDEKLKKRAILICDSHGVTLGEFLSECIKGLVEDYINPRFDREP